MIDIQALKQFLMTRALVAVLAVIGVVVAVGALVYVLATGNPLPVAVSFLAVILAVILVVGGIMTAVDKLAP
jgi:hypothetical protein